MRSSSWTQFPCRSGELAKAYIRFSARSMPMTYVVYGPSGLHAQRLFATYASSLSFINHRDFSNIGLPDALEGLVNRCSETLRILCLEGKPSAKVIEAAATCRGLQRLEPPEVLHSIEGEPL